METTSQLRPMVISDMLDTAFRLYRKHFVVFVGIVALLQVPITALQVLIQIIFGNATINRLTELQANGPVVEPGENPFANLPVGAMIAYYGLTLLLGLVQVLIIQQLISGALATAISRSYLGQEVTLLGSYRFGLGRLLSLIGASLLLTVITLAATLLIACPFGIALGLGMAGGSDRGTGVIVVLVLGVIGAVVLLFALSIAIFVRFLLTTQTIVLEGQNAVGGLRRSWQLVKGSFWRVIGTVALMAVITWLIMIIFSVPGSLLIVGATVALGPGALAWGQAIGTLFSQIGVILALPLQLAVFTLLYYDLRVRKEGYDLEVLANQIATS